MRILHVLDHSIPLHSAYSHRTLSLLRQQRALGWHTIQLTGPQQGKVETEDRNRDGWHFIRTAPGPGWVPPLLLARRMAQRLRHAIKLSRPDILHAHPPALGALAALWAGWRCGVPVLVEIHGASRTGLDNYTARAAGAVVTDSLALRAALLGCGVAPACITAIAPAIDPPRSAPDAWPGPLPAHAGPLLACIGPLDEPLLMAALAPLLRAHPALRLVLAAPVTARLSDFAALHDAVVLLPGQLGRDHVNALYAHADIALFPAPPGTSLAVSRKPLDAMAHGALVLASSTGAHRELIEHGRNGVLFEAGSVDSLVEAVRALLADERAVQPLRERARSFAVHERSWETAARSYAPLYQRLLEGVSC